MPMRRRPPGATPAADGTAAAATAATTATTAAAATAEVAKDSKVILVEGDCGVLA